MISGNYADIIGFLFIFKLENVRVFLKKTGTMGTK
jgi:hypothetical protein